ncbi:hypothetical protein R1flu_017907 [Riccia fluitans]|uniref:SAWADEE domain-containing protein n=1 Tax=Riccia fluitans TaxID=41844 RepID=A0ABD1ZHQ1_9MARC
MIINRTRRKSGRKNVVPAPPLEVRSLVDDGWYDGSVSLIIDGNSAKSAENRKVRVHFQGFHVTLDEFWGPEILSNEQEIRYRVRLQSHQLQDQECNLVAPDMVVCANFISPDGEDIKYYDAVVAQVTKAAHENVRKRSEKCNCRFTVLWREGPLRGRYGTLTCQHLSLHSKLDVRTHPIVDKILDYAAMAAEETESGSLVPPRTAPGSDNASSSEIREVVEDQEPLAQDHEVAEDEHFEKEVKGGGDLRADVNEAEKTFMVEEPKGVGELPRGLFQDEDFEMLDVQNQPGVREEDLQAEIGGPEEVQEQSTSGDGSFKENEISHGSFAEDVDIQDVQAQKSSGVKRVGEDIQMQEMQAQAFCPVDPEILALTEEEIREVKKGKEFPEEPEPKYVPYIRVTKLDWEEEIFLEKLREELNPVCTDFDDVFLDLPADVSAFKNNFQAIQTCLAHGALKLDRTMREVSSKNADTPTV